ncbi:MAG: type II toxin-antitoxin system VapC family toxin [Chloroflexota bacterium]
MPSKIYTVDASVFMNAFNPSETGHAESRRLLEWMQQQPIPIIAPTLLLPEVAATISRGRNDAQLARAFAANVSRLPHLTLVPLDTQLALQAADIAAQHRLRGSDATYAAVALRYGTTLVTLDREQHDRLLTVVATRYPVEALHEVV